MVKMEVMSDQDPVTCWFWNT